MPHAFEVTWHPSAATASVPTLPVETDTHEKSNCEIQFLGQIEVNSGSKFAHTRTLSFVATFEEFFGTRRHTPSASRIIHPLPAAPIPTLLCVDRR